MTNFNNCFISLNEIQIENQYLNNEYELFENNIIIKKGHVTSNISLVDEIDLKKLYYIKINSNIIEISKHNLYETSKFNTLFNYKGDLGVVVCENSIFIRVFAPTKYKIDLNIYKTGHEDDLIQSMKMKKKKGIFEIEIDKSFENFYYTFAVYDNINILQYTEVVDPYARTTGVNGLRGMISDLSTTKKINTPYPKRKFNEAIVYELHTRDLSTDASWNGNENYKGKFLGLIEKNTSYTKNNTTVTTGFDHIKELGVTDVQLLPIFDFFMVDESRLNDENYKNIKNGIFNWGYMGLNFNALEGSYSTNPYDGLIRVEEFKKVVEEFNKNNIGVIMDVVYNHTAFTEESNFNILVPGYYHRMKDNKFTNASACGNETASEKFMVRKFIVDSLVFWAKEYHLSGFRFDLMQIHDVETMNQVTRELRKIDSSIIVYGEPWTGGETPLGEDIQAGKKNLVKMKHVGAFNDEIRDGIKGSVFDFSVPGFVQGFGNDKMIEQIKYGIVGGVLHPHINLDYLNEGAWHTSSSKCVNYSSAHDNHTIWDKLTLSSSVSVEERKEMHKLTNSIVLLSQGLAFIHAGAEMCRSKPQEDGSLEDNSYDSSDYTNKIRWDAKIDNYDVFEFHRDLIKFRKDNRCFFLSDKKILDIKFNHANNDYISYTLDNKYLIIFNSTNKININLDSDYKIVMENNIFVQNNKTALLGDYTLNPNSTNIFKIR
ncbi:MAG: type I pullulanase [bacterium]